MAGTERDSILRAAIVGAGPAGFYAAVELLRNSRCAVVVDMFDRLPTPFGLVRHGVAPDHEKIRAVTAFYTKGVETHTAQYRMFGSVELGKDVSMRELRRRYHAVILAVGAQSDRKLAIAGEHLAGVHPASVFVAWYNGHPDFADASFDLSVDRAVVVGNGNVAVDVCRMLLRTPEELACTDTANHACEALRTSRIRELVLLGRSGPAQAAFTPTELKELTELTDTDVVVAPEDKQLDAVALRKYEAGELDPLKARNLQIVLENTRSEPRPGKRVVRLRFYSSPIELLGAERVTGVRIRRNRPVYRDGVLSLEPTDRIDDLSCGLVFRSIGYRVSPVEDVPFELDKNAIPNDRGQVLATSGGPAVPGLFVTGWAKRGPSGIIGTNKPDALETVTNVLDAFEKGQLPNPPEQEDMADALERMGVNYVSYSDWKLLDQLEIQSGRAEGRPRRKFTDVATMLRAIADARLTTHPKDLIVGKGSG